MPELDAGPERSVGPDLSAPTVSQQDRQPETPIDRAIGDGFKNLYAEPGIAHANYQHLVAFAGSEVANDIVARGGAGRLAALNPDLTRDQFQGLAGVLGETLSQFAPSREGAIAQIVPGGHVIRDAAGVPLVARASRPEQADAPTQEQSVQPPQWVAGVGIEARGQALVVSGSVVSGVVFDDDGSFGTFSAGGLGLGIGAGGQVGPTAFGIIGPDDIEDIGGLGVQFGGFAAGGLAADAGITIPLTSRGGAAGIGITLPAGPSAGGGMGAYSELGYTRVERLFELSELKARGGAALEDLPDASRRVVTNMMNGLGIESYAEMARYLVATQRSVARQVSRISGGGS